MKFTTEDVNRSVDKLQTASGYDITEKLDQHHMIERVRVPLTEPLTVDAINVLDAFCSCYSAIPAVSQT